MDYGYQKYYLEQIKKHKKNILVWFRQSGKSSLIVDYIIDYASKNSGKNIYISTTSVAASQHLRKMLHKKANINAPLSGIISVISNCAIIFSGTLRQFETHDGMGSVDVMIIDDFERMMIKHFDQVNRIINKFDPKIIFTSSQFTTETITYFDKGDYYLSVVSHSSVASRDKINETKMLMGPGYPYEYEYGNIEELYSELGIIKDRSLIDIWGLKAQRKRKLEEISKKIKENNDD